jgi:hypothetical protein
MGILMSPRWGFRCFADILPTACAVGYMYDRQLRWLTTLSTVQRLFQLFKERVNTYDGQPSCIAFAQRQGYIPLVRICAQSHAYGAKHNHRSNQHRNRDAFVVEQIPFQ